MVPGVCCDLFHAAAILAAGLDVSNARFCPGCLFKAGWGQWASGKSRLVNIAVLFACFVLSDTPP
ncbi:hypothetical protein AUQ42_03760 [Thalassospira sp. MCCC 1A02491]|nr:hypothetical protein AUQ42_03760 [Thalassospira sp. MCCC 1A02491]